MQRGQKRSKRKSRNRSKALPQQIIDTLKTDVDIDMRKPQIWLIGVLTLRILFAAVPPLAAQSDGTPIPADTSLAVRHTLQQSLGEIVRIRTTGGGEFQGKLLAVEAERIEIQDSEGLVLQIVASEITEVLTIDPAAKAETYYQDAAANKLILMPVGFGMEPGALHIADQEIVMVSMSYGVSRAFSLWGAVSIPGLLLNARFSFEPREKIGLSLGSFAGLVFFQPVFIALPYGIASFGSLNRNFTIGLGGALVYGWESGVPDSDYYLLGGTTAIGGRIVLSQTTSIVTENWIVVGTMKESGRWWGHLWSGYFPALAFRVAGSRFSWDVGVIMPFSVEYDDDSNKYAFEWFLEAPIPIPILGFTYRIK